MTPLEAIRKRCLDCEADGYSAVKACDSKDCPLHKHRTGRGRASVRVIKAYCLWCSGGSIDNLRLCPDGGCPLWPFRKGTNPNITAETREALSARAKARGFGRKGGGN